MIALALRRTFSLLVFSFAMPVCFAQGSGAGGGAAGAGSASNGATGAAAHAAAESGAPSATSGGTQSSATQPGSGPSTYAAAASAGSDPRVPPHAKPGAMTLQQVLDRARQRNPTLQAAQQNLHAVRAQELQAGVRANPYVGFAGSNVTLPSDASNPYAYSLQVSRLFERGNKREYRLDNARATTSQTEAQLQDTIRQTELNVRQAFTSMLIAKEALQLTRAQLVDFRHEVEIGRDRFQAGDLGKLDFERLDLQLGASEADEQNAEIAVEQASDHLQMLMGIAVSSPDFDVTGPIVPPPVTQTREEVLATALQRRPDLRAASFSIAAADAAAKLAIAQGTADPTLEVEYDKTGTDNSAGFNVNIPLRIFDRNQGNKETARLQAQAAVLTEQATRNQVASDVNQAWSAYIHARVLSNRFGDHYLDESADVLSIARYAFDHGGLALIDYLDALRGARAATSDALNAYSQTWMAIHTLSAAAGADLVP
ncbi:outer membrane protein [Terriglobus roseus DSM 18391]|uniref:Outer membrane protein n=1 Tax=Terriglobus roseus (strain DSM 18391 / NRRL B-41598 / KBS 63) TaxID=926566 RepID=I3ZE77_TERRK|nr:TolC family protein [Terriglobus roseus]AFL87545.1 outer membrane protein [Terriglobus roseus DSM 18391]